MALEPTPEPLDRARRAAREEQPEGWIELSESIMSQVRSLVTPSDPILAFTGAGSARDAEGSRTYVSARVVTSALRRLLQREPTHAPDGIRLHVQDDRLTAIDLNLVCAYGVDLVALADSVRHDVLVEVERLIGPDPSLGPAAVSIDITDVVEGDPNLI